MIERKLDDYEVVSVKSGREMREVLDRVNPSLILLDVVIPDGDGFEIAREISSSEKYAHIPIVFITSKTEGKDVEIGFNSGGFDYVKKPFDMVELRARIKSAMRKKQLEQDLKSLTYTDYLTGAYTRRYFIDALLKELEKRKRSEGSVFSVALSDIDFFKNVNDTFGHLAGDYVLTEFVRIIRKSIRPYDLLARYGGEEFIILFSDCAKENAAEVMQRIEDSMVRVPILYGDKSIQVTFSTGIADLNDVLSEERMVESIIRLADQRLYAAKQKGRKRIEIQ
jgi:two-component system, cell cycle response regulator